MFHRMSKMHWLVTLLTSLLSVQDPLPSLSLYLYPSIAHIGGLFGHASGCPCSVEAFSHKMRGSGRGISFQGSVAKPFTSKCGGSVCRIWLDPGSSPGNDLTSLNLSYSICKMGLIRVPVL